MSIQDPFLGGRVETHNLPISLWQCGLGLQIESLVTNPIPKEYMYNHCSYFLFRHTALKLG